MKTLGEKLFNLVQASQGFSFISDGIGDFSDDEVIKIAKNSLTWTKETIGILEKFIREHKIRRKSGTAKILLRWQ